MIPFSQTPAGRTLDFSRNNARLARRHQEGIAHTLEESRRLRRARRSLQQPFSIPSGISVPRTVYQPPMFDRLLPSTLVHIASLDYNDNRDQGYRPTPINEVHKKPQPGYFQKFAEFCLDRIYEVLDS